MAASKMTWKMKIGLAIAFVLVFMRFVFVPLTEWRDETIKQVRVFQNSVAQKKALVGNEKSIDAVAQKTEAAYTATAAFYYQGFTDVQALQLELQKEIEQISSSSAVEIKSIDWLPPQEGEIVQAPIKIRCAGVSDQIVKFIAQIEQGKQFRSIDRVKILAMPNETNVNAEIDVSARGIKEQTAGSSKDEGDK